MAVQSMNAIAAIEFINTFNLQSQNFQKMKMTYIKRIAAWILPALLLSIQTQAQPSGGPYGPVRQTYQLPTVTGKIYFVAPDGKSEASGETLTAPTTIEKAIEQVKTGDAIVMRGGTYRTGNLEFNQGITIQPYLDEQPVLKGSYIAGEWKDLGNGLWTTKWTHLFPQNPADWWQRNRSGKSTPLHRFNDDMVFVDGRFLQSAAYEGEVTENSFYIDYETGTVYIGTNPKNKLVEITAYNVGFHRVISDCHGKVNDHKGPVIKGITLTQYAYRALEVDGKDPEGISPETNHGKDVIGTVLENCSITFCSRVAAYLRGDKMILRNCKISDTSTEGIYILSSSDVLLERNIFTRNNIERISGYYPSAVKIFNQCYRVTCNDNLVTDLPYSNGIWWDVGNVDAVFTNNWVEGVGLVDRNISYLQTWPSESGFFFEISKGAVCAGNVFVNCELGIHILNSCDARIYNNTLINSTACLSRSERSAAGDHFGWHPATGPDVDERDGHVFVNNLLSGDDTYKRPMVFIWQRKMLCDRLTEPQTEKMDYNAYVPATVKKNLPMILWSPAKNDSCIIGFENPADLNKLRPEFEVHSMIYKDYPVFISKELKNYRILPQYDGLLKGAPLPADISALLKRPKKDVSYVGAYPLVR